VGFLNKNTKFIFPEHLDSDDVYSDLHEIKNKKIPNFNTPMILTKTLNFMFFLNNLSLFFSWAKIKKINVILERVIPRKSL
jgi:hypothetical protein